MRVKNEYHDALGAMARFAALFLETGTKVQKDVRLVKALIDLIQQDDSIQPDDEFYIDENGGKIKKTALGGLQKICLPAFLLGVWHYVVINRKDNSVGRDTYDEWCPEKGRAARTYSGGMGKNIATKIDVYMPQNMNSRKNLQVMKKRIRCLTSEMKIRKKIKLMISVIKMRGKHHLRQHRIFLIH